VRRFKDENQLPKVIEGTTLREGVEVISQARSAADSSRHRNNAHLEHGNFHSLLLTLQQRVRAMCLWPRLEKLGVTLLK
jgi:hypothetical protein